MMQKDKFHIIGGEFDLPAITAKSYKLLVR